MTSLQELNNMLNETTPPRGSDSPTEAIPKITAKPKGNVKNIPLPKPPKQPRPQKTETCKPTDAPKPRKQAAEPETRKQAAAPVKTDEWAPVQYDANHLDVAKDASVVAAAAFIFAAVVSEAIGNQPAFGWTLAVLGMIGVIAFIISRTLLRQVIVTAVERSYGVNVIQYEAQSDPHHIRIRYTTPHKSAISDGIIIYRRDLAWIADAEEKTIVPRNA